FNNSPRLNYLNRPPWAFQDQIPPDVKLPVERQKLQSPLSSVWVEGLNCNCFNNFIFAGCFTYA
ncbi:MAG: hypothetical protein Q4D17_02580, partial [Planctomycetia bacterium]|nr:hypothetical protein [Planctomycetia bacterium]